MSSTASFLASCSFVRFFILLSAPFLLLFLLYPVSTVATIPVVRHTKYGALRGFVHSPSQASPAQQIDVFFGVPYARPPIGNLRFEPPLAPLSWESVREAGESAKPAACVPHARPDPQQHLHYSEDCLYLNVFAPHQDGQGEKPPSTLYPVLLLIHGGAYEIGSSAKYSNYDLLGARFVVHGLVMVSINYRLGVLGFATTGDKEMTGNIGIRDQIAALEYVKENIAAFGGDPGRVTVLGYSAGSGSAGLLSIIPAAKDLFHQTVRMSGAILSSSGSGTFVPGNTRQLADVLDCGADADPSNSSQIKACLQQKSIEEIFEGVQNIGPAPVSYTIAKFGPNRWDSELFPLDHADAIRHSLPKPTMLGFTELDFLLMTMIMDRNTSVSLLALTDEQMAIYGLPAFMSFLRDYVAKDELFGDQADAIRADLFDFYVNKYGGCGQKQYCLKDAAFFLRLYSMVCSDLMMVVPLLWETQIRTRDGGNDQRHEPVYLYEYKYVNPAVFPARVKVHVAYHDYDHSLLFDQELIKNGQDRNISEFLIDAVVNFVKSGNPSSEAVKWETTPSFSLADADSVSHMEIGEMPRQTQGMQGELKRLHFWLEIGRKYGAKFDLVRGTFGGNGAAVSQHIFAACTVAAVVCGAFGAMALVQRFF